MKPFYYIIIILLCITSCSSEFLETHSTSRVDESTVFLNTKNAQMALDGVFKRMYYNGDQSQNYMGYETMLVMSDLMGEDILFGARTTLFLQSYNWSVHRTVTSAMMNYCYRYHYNIIANVNLIIENIDNADGEQIERDHIKGKALVVRAAHYFNLVRMWAKRYNYESGQENSHLGVPLILTSEAGTDPQPQATVKEIYEAINNDLDAAIELLDGMPTRTNKINPNQSVANGLKSRVLLTMGLWEEAANYAKVARTSEYSLSQTIFTETPSRFCSQSNSEWMWGTLRIKSEDEGFSSLQVFFGNTDAITTREGPKCIYNNLYHRMSDTDKRKACFAPTKAIANSDAFSRPRASTEVPAYFNNKYMVPDHSDPQVDCPYMRVAEMYLNEAEALARLGRNSEAQQVLYDLIITRDPAYNKSTQTSTALIEEILLHRRFELWGEGFRYFDLKRMNMPLDRSLPAVFPDGTLEVTNHNASWAQYLEIPAGDKKWEFLYSDNEMENNPYIVQNEL
ncbi:MAG: RagB/SusD family nutrient uptake outer membrane protein [Tannerella sp.]|nr:RagB/SusD family nutrient uptake outer membrane protein [Tannerella sp.]